MEIKGKNSGDTCFANGKIRVEKSVDNVDNMLANFSVKKLCKTNFPGCAPGYGKSSVINVKKYRPKILKFWP